MCLNLKIFCTCVYFAKSPGSATTLPYRLPATAETLLAAPTAEAWSKKTCGGSVSPFKL